MAYLCTKRVTMLDHSSYYSFVRLKQLPHNYRYERTHFRLSMQHCVQYSNLVQILFAIFTGLESCLTYILWKPCILTAVFLLERKFKSKCVRDVLTPNNILEQQGNKGWSREEGRISNEVKINNNNQQKTGQLGWSLITPFIALHHSGRKERGTTEKIKNGI